MNFSVLLSLYKKENPEYLRRALGSIWDDQTLKPDQIVLVKDGPLTPDLDTAVEEFGQKIGDIFTVVDLPENVGLGAALNEGLKYCNHELVARMDTNDVSLPERFEKQIAFMEKNADIAASSGILEEWDESLDRLISVRFLPASHEELLRFARFRSPLSHPAAIFRKSIVVGVGGYPPFRRWQDYALWSVILNRGYRLANIDEVLCRQRTGNEFLKRRGLDFKNAVHAFWFQREIGFVTTGTLLFHIIAHFVLCFSPGFMKKLFYVYGRRIRGSRHDLK
jgi:glycosyltransferase involved in cell wall biosynthesis